jgi:hypothetical protein
LASRGFSLDYRIGTLGWPKICRAEKILSRSSDLITGQDKPGSARMMMMELAIVGKV